MSDKKRLGMTAAMLMLGASVAWFVASVFSGQSAFIAVGAVFLVLGLVKMRQARTH
jgi:hypothetical protein